MRPTALPDLPATPEQRPGARRMPTAGLAVTLIALGTLLLWRCGRRRADDSARDFEVRRARRLLNRVAGGAEDVNHQLGTIRGYCEVAKIKGESGGALARRMDAAIDAVAETSALFQQLLVAGRQQDAAIDRL